MANVDHNSLTDPLLHEPKGVAAASAGQVYVADGAGSGDWRYLPHAGCYYTNIGTGTTFTAPTSYTLCNPTTVAAATLRGFTHNSAGRLTYTGTDTVEVSFTVSLCVKMSAGTVDTYFKLYRSGSGVTGTEVVTTTNNTTYETATITANVTMATNEYVEVYLKAGSGNIIVHALSITAIGLV